MSSGRVLGGRYQLQAILGQGGMGVVHTARDRHLGRLVALKRVLAPGVPGLRERLEREVSALSRCEHPHLVRVLDWHGAGDESFLVMELVEGETLSRRLEAKGPLAPEALIQLTTELSSAIDSLHDQGLFHRDIKPCNIMLRPGNLGAVLMDLGLVRDLDAESLTETGTLFGTPRYLPPEVVAGAAWTAAADQYQLGAVLFEAATCQPLVPGETVTQVLQNLASGLRAGWSRPGAGLSTRFREAVDRSVMTLPSARFPDCETFAEALGPGRKRVGVAPEKPPGPSARSGRGPRWFGAIFGAVVLISGLLLQAGSRPGGESPTPVPGEVPSELIPSPRLPFPEAELPARVGAELQRLRVSTSVDPDPFQWPVYLERLPATRAFLTWRAEGGDTRVLSRRLLEQLRELDSSFAEAGLPRPFSSFVHPQAAPETALTVLGPRVLGLSLRQGALLARPLVGRRAEALGLLEDLLSRVEQRNQWSTQLNLQDLPPGFDPGLTTVLWKRLRSLDDFQWMFMKYRQNRITAVTWFAPELERFERFLMVAGEALDQGTGDDALALLLANGLVSLDGLQICPALGFHPLSMVGGAGRTPAARLFRGVLLNRTRRFRRQHVRPGAEPTLLEHRLLEEALVGPGAGEAATARRRLGASWLAEWYRQKGDLEGSELELDRIRSVIRSLDPSGREGLIEAFEASLEG